MMGWKGWRDPMGSTTEIPELAEANGNGAIAPVLPLSPPERGPGPQLKPEDFAYVQRAQAAAVQAEQELQRAQSNYAAAQANLQGVLAYLGEMNGVQPPFAVTADGRLEPVV